MVLKSKIIISIISFILCLAATAGILVAINYDEWFAPEPPPGPVIDPSAGEYEDPNPPPQASQGIAIPGWTTITIAANTKKVTVDFPNPSENRDKYYLTFQLRLKETGEVLYQSGLVPPGLHIQSITLNRELSAGTYDIVIHVQPYTMDDAISPTNNADVEVKLIVVN